jgi:hypothetical protein
MAGFIKEAELALLGGLIVGVFFAAMKLIRERFFSGEIDNKIYNTTVNHPTALETW